MNWQNLRTRNFTIQEVIHSPADLFPERLAPVAIAAMHYMQACRDYLGVPLVITSGYRSPAYNEEIGGSENSYHVWRFTEDGHLIFAVDCYSSKLEIQLLYEDLKKLVVGEVYWHKGRGFVHVSPYGKDESWIQS
jgi:uncharacterized protein YcbK (DUF882 family)